jgi:hypothetical protein
MSIPAPDGGKDHHANLTVTVDHLERVLTLFEFEPQLLEGVKISPFGFQADCARAFAPL